MNGWRGRSGGGGGVCVIEQLPVDDLDVSLNHLQNENLH